MAVESVLSEGYQPSRNARTAAVARLRILSAPAATALTGLAFLIFIGWFSYVVLARHAALESNAADLGYYSQAAWNTAQGRPFRTTLMEAMVVRIPADVDPATLRDPGSLLAFHVEPIFFVIGLFYRVWPGTETLLLIQVAGVAAGAWAVHRVAARSLGSVWAGPAFATAYLLAPPIHWALLSDFHPTVVGAGALAFVYDFALGNPAPVTRTGLLGRLASLARRWDLGLFLAAVLALSAREDVALVVLPIALFRLIRGPRRWAGGLLCAGAAAWLAVCALVILPAHGTNGPSPYVYRYGHLGGDVETIIRTVLTQPLRVLGLLFRPEADRFLSGAVAMTGGLWIFAPLAILPALPIWSMNTLSTWPWMASGEAHYAILIMPPLFIAAAIGAGRIARLLGRIRLPGRFLVAGWILLSAVLWTRVDGLTFLRPDYAPPAVSAHDRLLPSFAALIPPDAPVSASTTIYPHLSSREKIYLYPTVRDAEFILVDISAPSFPTTTPDQYWRLWTAVEQGPFGVLAAADGYLLLQRGGGQKYFPRELLSFAVKDAPAPVPPGQLSGTGPVPYRVRWHTTHAGPDRVVRISTDWATRDPLPDRQIPVAWAHVKGGISDLGAEAPGLWWIQTLPLESGRQLRIDFPDLAADQVKSLEIGPLGGPTREILLTGSPSGEVVLTP